MPDAHGLRVSAAAIIWASDRQQYDAVKFLFDRGAIPFGCMQWAKAPAIVDLLTSNGCARGDNQKLDMENGKVFVKPEFLSAVVC